MRRPRAAVLASLAAVVAASAPAAARAEIADYLGRPVASVRLTIEGRAASEPRLLALVETRVGQPLSMIAVRESIAHLFSLSRFENVVVQADIAENGGIALVYELMPLHPIESFAFTGQLDRPGVSEGGLRRAIADRYGAAPPVARAPDIALLIEGQLKARGYLAAKVTSRVVIEHAPDLARLLFAIDPGPRARIGAVEITGDAGMPEAELRDRLGLATGAPYEPDALDARRDRYLSDRREAGHYSARLTLGADFLEGGSEVRLRVDVDQGPRVRVVFRGDPLPASRRDDLVPIAREGSTDEDLLEDSANAIVSYLRSQGHRDAAATFTRERASGDERITFTVTRGPAYRVAAVDLTGVQAFPAAELVQGLRTRAGRPFSAAAVDDDVAAIEDYYRRRGFGLVEAAAVVRPAEGPPGGGPTPVDVRIAVVEHVRTVVGSAAIRGNVSVPQADLLPALGLQPGAPFFVTQLAIDRDQIQYQYANRGFLSAVVESNPGLSGDGARADVVFTVHEGPRLFVDHVLIVGNERTRVETIERELQLGPGDPLSLAAVTDTQRRLASLGLFRRARITQLGHGDETTRDLVVTVEEAPATTAGYGGGLEVGRFIVRTEQGGVASEDIDFAPRAFFEIGRRNLFGKNRSINLFTGVSLRRKDSVVPAGEILRGGAVFGFSEYRVLGTYREPRALGAADAVLTGTVEQQIRSSFDFRRQAFNAEAARRLTSTLSASASYGLQRTELFNQQISPADKLLVDRLFPQLRLSSFSGALFLDTRNDPIDPGHGHYASASGQLAARRIGSEVGFVKSFFTAQLFRTLARRVVLALNGRLGMATGFPRDIAGDLLRDLPASERFFAGGDTTVRGFALDRLGTPETIDQDGFPIGGNSVAIGNVELRVPVGRGLGVVGFVDAGNVYAHTVDLDLGELRTAVGFGLRYKSPVGPVRFDVGFNIDRREVVPGVTEPLRALHITLGQAF